MRALAARVGDKSNVVVNAVNPGYCKSDLVHDYEEGFFMRYAIQLSLYVARTTEEGGRSLVHAAVTVDSDKALNPEDLESDAAGIPTRARTRRWKPVAPPSSEV